MHNVSVCWRGHDNCFQTFALRRITKGFLYLLGEKIRRLLHSSPVQEQTCAIPPVVFFSFIMQVELL